ncbi:MAG: alpha/beta hydrolase [Nocardia sp.]|nr:alpha/beta hydrolase [Nocardia sp.]
MSEQVGESCTGWSEDVALPRTLDDVTDEIADLLSALGVESTVTLVGHSLGGTYAQHFAQRFPERVARLVLVDPLHQDWDDFVPPELQFGAVSATGNVQMPELPAEAIDRIRSAMEIAFSGFPAELGTALLDLHMSAERFPVGFREGSNAAHLLDELREGGPLPDVPTLLGYSWVERITVADASHANLPMVRPDVIAAGFAPATPEHRQR